MCITDTRTRSGKKAMNDVLKKDKIKEAIPAECFEKSLFWSCFWMGVDYSMWLGSTAALWYLHTSGIYETLPVYQQYAATITHWLVAGFFMWGMFVVGHDCGHTTFSNYTFINDVVGHITHGSILVPYYPWRRSHNLHHMFHNHVDKDYSHPWYTEEKLRQPEFELARAMENYPLMRLLFPIVGWPIYLYGMPDGSHWYPFKDHRLWLEASAKEMGRCLLSTAVVVAYAAAIFYLNNCDMGSMFYYYLAPLWVSGWWLVCVTYLQHHDHDTLVYDDENWKFVDAAFETVDREFTPFGILDKLMHNITNCHVVHHLFFTNIPHYNLAKATEAMKVYLNENGAGSLYKFEKTHDYAWRLHKYMYMFGFRATEAPKKVN
jgi:acyl-lipid omega-3 desaturase